MTTTDTEQAATEGVELDEKAHRPTTVDAAALGLAEICIFIPASQVVISPAPEPQPTEEKP